MAKSNVAPPPPPRKPPRVVKLTESPKLLERHLCGVDVFWCRMGGRRVAVEVLEARAGDIAIQTQLLSDELTASSSGAPTFYRLHACPRSRSFTQALGAGKRK